MMYVWFEQSETNGFNNTIVNSLWLLFEDAYC